MKGKILFILITCLFLPGCWDLTEVEQIGLVTAIGVDLAENNNIKLTVQEINPQIRGDGGGGDQLPFHLHIGNGDTVFDAIRKLYSDAPHRLFFAHTQVIILSEELARSRGIRPIIDFFERDHEFRRNTWLLIAKKGQLDKILSTDTPLNQSAGQILDGIIKMRQKNSLFAVNRLGDFIELFGESSNETYTAGVSLITRPTGEKPANGSSDQKPKTINLNVLDTAVFRGDKLVGWLNDRESRGLLWVKGEVNGGIITTTLEGKRLALEIIRSYSKVIPKIVDGKMQINIRIKVLSSISESQADVDFSKKKIIESVQQLQAEEVKREILMAIDKSTQLGTDVFGFGRHFYAKYPTQWQQIKQNWYDYYPDIEVNIAVDSVIRRIGLISKPVERPQGGSE